MLGLCSFSVHRWLLAHQFEVLWNVGSSAKDVILPARCEVADIFLEMDRILRPNGWVIIREEGYYRSIAENLASSLHWELKYSKNTTDEVLLAYQKTFWRPEL